MATYAHQGDTSPDAAKFRLQAISADGRTIVGSSGGGLDVPQQPTVWHDGIPSALPATSPYGEITDVAPTSVSDDGRIIGGYVHLNTPQLSTMQAVVWVDGTLKLLEPSHNYPAFGAAQVVSGFGGDPNNWLAIGENWVAGQDGVVHWLHDYVDDNYGLSLRVDNRSIRLLADSQAIYLVRYETPSTVCAGLNCYTNGQYAAHLLVLPHDYEPPAFSAAYDLSNDGHVTAIDALIIINALNDGSGLSFIDRPELRQAQPRIDANGDGDLSASDALVLINFLNQPTSANATSDIVGAEGEANSESHATAADEYFRDFWQPRRKPAISNATS